MTETRDAGTADGRRRPTLSSTTRPTCSSRSTAATFPRCSRTPLRPLRSAGAARGVRYPAQGDASRPRARTRRGPPLPAVRGPLPFRHGRLRRRGRRSASRVSDTEAAMMGEAGPGLAGPAGDGWSLLARLWGDNADKERHTLLTRGQGGHLPPAGGRARPPAVGRLPSCSISDGSGGRRDGGARASPHVGDGPGNSPRRAACACPGGSTRMRC